MTFFCTCLDLSIKNDLILPPRFVSALVHLVPDGRVVDSSEYASAAIFRDAVDHIVVDLEKNTVAMPKSTPLDYVALAYLNQSVFEYLLEENSKFIFPGASVNINDDECVLLSLHSGCDETLASAWIAAKNGWSLTGDKTTIVDGQLLKTLHGSNSNGYFSESNSFYSFNVGEPVHVKYEETERSIKAIVYAWIQPEQGFITKITSNQTRAKLIHCAFLSAAIRGTGRMLGGKSFPSFDNESTEDNRGEFIARLSEKPLYELRGTLDELSEWFGSSF